MPRTITVTGRGSAVAVPDTAVVDVAVVGRAAVLADAVAAVDAAAVALVRVARRLTEASQVASHGLQVWPVHDPSGRPESFEATHRFRVVCAGLPTASALVSGLVAEVGDSLRVDGVRLEVGAPDRALAAAREGAFADARERARQLAALAGSGLGDVLAVVEGAGVAPPGPLLADTRAAAFEPGETDVGSEVTVTWQLV